MTLRPADFAEYFTAIHGHDPFPWQQRLVEQLADENRWPDVLDLPTGTGKTAALDVAVFHLALQANCPQRRAALRIVLVVDRRLGVCRIGRTGAGEGELGCCGGGIITWGTSRFGDRHGG